MGKVKPRSIEKGGLVQKLNVSSSGSSHVPSAPVYYPNEEEFKDPLKFIDKIRPEAEQYGICKIVPPKSWSPPFALDLDKFSFPTKTQAIHQLQARPASCDSKTFELEYNRFLEVHCGKKLKKKVVFEGEELDLCKLFNAVKRFGGYDKVAKAKKWGEVSRFLKVGMKISECAKHVLCQLYREHLYDYEKKYCSKLNREIKNCKRGVQEDKKSGSEGSCLKRRRKNGIAKKIMVCDELTEDSDLDQICCEQCKSGLHGEVMLLCDRCNKGWHIYCLSPPFKQIPPGNWYCFECLNSDKDSFGFVPGKCYSVEAFRRIADRAKKKWFGLTSTSRVQLEKKFWEIVDGLAGEVEVLYGSDLDTSVYGSGFPRASDQRPESVDLKLWDKYCRSPWNLNNLPKLAGSVLQAVNHNITGVMVPWLYVGMLFSSFCWHFEDHCFYSMNYLHWGEPKCWYSIPGEVSSAFEKVMRNCLPDLFEAQPDLLFQLVTMLNPSVLQEYGVPVYTVQQEPGNFVITFPRSYHAGFNFGLNCAEAVNFAPADWLPHGGYGAKLYQMYHKTAVISHEELLCVVAKGELDGQASLHLKRELLRIYNREKTCRERLWRGGIVKSSQMPPRKCPEYVGREEDPACVICKQYLYLSAVSCRCRPSAFVCLEHWEHICECKPSRLRLLYRHTLAELYDLVLRVDDCGFKEKSQGNLQGPIFSQELNSLTKKVKGSHISLMQLAEQWLSRSCELFKNQSSSDAFCTVLKEAEQFLWAGCEMDPVRKMVNDLVTAKKWVEGIRDCISRLDNWSSDCDLEKVHIESIVELLNTDPLPYKEPGLLKLKEHAEKARQLTEEINSALSSYLNVTELEALFQRATDFPIKLKEHEKLSEKLSAAKVWLKDADKCLSEQSFAAISLDVLYKLKFQIMELQVQMPETDILLDLLTRAELCQSQCKDILETLTSIKNVEVVLEEFSNFSVYVPELMLLKQYLTDATSWIDRCNSVLVNVHEREDHDSVIDELNFLLKDRLSLRIKVNEVYFLESELRKVCCRAKALKASKTVVPLIFIQELMREAVLLQIQDEMIFVNISGVLATALLWEEKAINVLADGAQMSEFEDIIRASEDIHVTLPSLDRVKDAVVVAKFWLKNSEPFLAAHSSTLNDSYSLLKHAALKELVLQSESLGIFLDEKNVLKKLLSSCEQWERVALSEMQDAESILNKSCYHDGKNKDLIFEIENVVNRMGSTVQYGFSLGFDFPMIPKLQNACSMLQWCIRALSLCIVFPTLEDVEVLLQAATNHYDAALPATLLSSLTDGLKWIKKALEVSLPSSMEHYKLSDAEEVLAQYESRNLSFPLIVDQLKLAIRSHNSWRNQADQFFSLSSEEQSWSAIFELKECGKASAFNCIELDMVLAKVRKVENWKEKCANVIGRLVDDRCSLLGALQKIKKSLDISSHVYGKEGSTNLLVCCISCYGDQELLTCSTCKDCYHSKCLEPELVDVTNTELPVCPYCQLLSNVITTFGKVSGLVRFGGTRPDSKLLTELLSEAEGFDGIEEKDALQQVVEQACEYTSHMMEIIGSALLYMDKDLKFLFEKLLTALKAIAAACINDHDIAVEFELALARYSWKVRIDKLLLGIQKPTMQQIHQCIKEGLAITIPPEDYFLLELTKLKHLGLQWADRAKKVAADNGALALDKVFELITEIESLPLYLEKELKLLQARSKLYCICRKPYDNRAKVVCNQCDEWYHIDCIKLLYPRKAYMCPACDPQYEEFSKRQIDHERLASNKLVEPKTPSRLHANLMKPRRNLNGTEYGKKITLRKANDVHSGTSSIEILGWRNRKPFRRTTKRRTEMESLFPNFQIHP